MFKNLFGGRKSSVAKFTEQVKLLTRSEQHFERDDRLLDDMVGKEAALHSALLKNTAKAKTREEKLLTIRLWRWLLANGTEEFRQAFALDSQVVAKIKRIDQSDVSKAFFEMILDVATFHKDGPNGAALQEMLDSTFSEKTMLASRSISRSDSFSSESSGRSSVATPQRISSMSLRPSNRPLSRLSSNLSLRQIQSHCQTLLIACDLFVEALNFNQGYLGNNKLARELYEQLVQMNSANEKWLLNTTNSEAGIEMLLHCSEQIDRAFQLLAEMTRQERELTIGASSSAPAAPAAPAARAQPDVSESFKQSAKSDMTEIPVILKNSREKFRLSVLSVMELAQSEIGIVGDMDDEDEAPGPIESHDIAQELNLDSLKVDTRLELSMGQLYLPLIEEEISVPTPKFSSISLALDNPPTPKAAPNEPPKKARFYFNDPPSAWNDLSTLKDQMANAYSLMMSSHYQAISNPKNAALQHEIARVFSDKAKEMHDITQHTLSTWVPRVKEYEKDLTLKNRAVWGLNKLEALKGVLAVMLRRQSSQVGDEIVSNCKEIFTVFTQEVIEPLVSIQLVI
ncbi:hypothetical protein HDU91_005964 [Kappamyces sp. JEL0680]|nr:hypothetical protein HDU91_005964 [Kappamyces sp. JEL0680]